MTYYAHIVDVPAPAGVYDATHAAELLRRTGGHVDGLLVHVPRRRGRLSGPGSLDRSSRLRAR